MPLVLAGYEVSLVRLALASDHHETIPPSVRHVKTVL
jgi:hypothetical protein